MTYALEVHAAPMRCKNEANLRAHLLGPLERRARNGRVARAVYERAKLQYWEDRARDQRISQGKKYPTTEASGQRL